MNKENVHQFKLDQIVQVGFVVRDIEKVSLAWTSLFGLGPWKFHDVEGTDDQGHYKGIYHKERLGMTVLAGLNIELIQPLEGKAMHAEFLETSGEGLQHIQVQAIDPDGEAANLVAQGAEVLLSKPGGAHYMSNLSGGLVLEIVPKRKIT